MAYRAYVGNLPFSFTKAELEQLFQSFGTVKSAEVITDRETGRSRGFGFVEMETAEQLQAAMTGLHGKPVGGRSLTVNEARERDARGPGGPRPGGGGGFRSGPPRGPGGPGAGPSGPRPGGASGFGPPRPAGAGPSGGGRKWEREGDRDRSKRRGMDDYDRHDKSWKRGDDAGW